MGCPLIQCIEFHCLGVSGFAVQLSCGASLETITWHHGPSAGICLSQAAGTLNESSFEPFEVLASKKSRSENFGCWGWVL